MASSLDDMEAYELLQIELDRALQRYGLSLPEGSTKKQSLHFINSWIEYICFHRHLSQWQEIVAADTESSFVGWYKELVGEDVDIENAVKQLHAFQKINPQPSAPLR